MRYLVSNELFNKPSAEVCDGVIELRPDDFDSVIPGIILVGSGCRSQRNVVGFSKARLEAGNVPD